MYPFFFKKAVQFSRMCFAVYIMHDWGEPGGGVLQKVIYALLKAVWVTLASTYNKLQLKGDFNEQGGKINLFYSAHFKWMQSL